MIVLGFRALTVLPLLFSVKAFQVRSSLPDQGHSLVFSKCCFKGRLSERKHHSTSSQLPVMSADGAMNALLATDSISSTISIAESWSNGATLMALFACVIGAALMRSGDRAENQITIGVKIMDKAAEDWPTVYEQATARANLEIAAQEGKEKVQQAQTLEKQKTLQQELEKKTKEAELTSTMKLKEQKDTEKVAALKEKRQAEEAEIAAFQAKRLKEEDARNTAILRAKREKDAESASRLKKQEEEKRKLKQAQEETFLKLQLKREAEEAAKKAKRDLELRLELESRKRQSLATAKAATVAAKAEIERAKSQRTMEMEVENLKPVKTQSSQMNVKSVVQEKIEEVVSDIGKSFGASARSHAQTEQIQGDELPLDESNAGSDVQNEKETKIESDIEKLDETEKNSLSLRSMIKKRSVIIVALSIVVAQRLIRVYFSRGLV